MSIDQGGDDRALNTLIFTSHRVEGVFYHIGQKLVQLNWNQSLMHTVKGLVVLGCPLHSEAEAEKTV